MNGLVSFGAWLKRALAQSADSRVTRERVKALNAAVLLAADQADTGIEGILQSDVAEALPF